MTHTLRLFAVPNGGDSEAPTALAAPEATQMQEIDITSPNTDNVAADNTETHTDTDNVACDLSQRLEAARTIVTTETSAASTAHNEEVAAMNIMPMHACQNLMQVAVSDICVNLCSLTIVIWENALQHTLMRVQLRSTISYTAWRNYKQEETNLINRQFSCVLT